MSTPSPQNVEDDIVDTDFLLPFGDDLRSFLAQPYIDSSHLRQLLRKRNVFIISSDKKDLIPYLTETILEPTEFSELLECVKGRIDSKKIILSQYKLSNVESSLIELYQDDFNLAAIADDPNGNYEILHSPMFIHKDHGSSESLQINYKVLVKHHTSDWMHSKRVHDGNILIEKGHSSTEAKVTSSHTAPQTDKVNRIVEKHIETRGREVGLFKSNKAEKILFSSFSHAQRVAFFLKFSAVPSTRELVFDRFPDFDFKIDQSVDLPKRVDIAWIKNKVSDIKLAGSKLIDTIFFTEPEIHPCLIVWKIIAEYKFETIDAKGSFKAVLEFGGYSLSNNPSSCFQVSIDPKIKFEQSDSNTSITDLKRFFEKSLNKRMSEAFKESTF